MPTVHPAKITPHLWFAEKAVEAANFYASLFPDSRVDSVTDVPADTPSGPAGSVPDRVRARRVTEAMLGMEKLDLAALERAYRG